VVIAALVEVEVMVTLEVVALIKPLVLLEVTANLEIIALMKPLVLLVVIMVALVDVEGFFALVEVGVMVALVV